MVSIKPCEQENCNKKNVAGKSANPVYIWKDSITREIVEPSIKFMDIFNYRVEMITQDFK